MTKKLKEKDVVISEREKTILEREGKISDCEREIKRLNDLLGSSG
jgi:uncharacterized protein (DUF3084 family)